MSRRKRFVRGAIWVALCLAGALPASATEGPSAAGSSRAERDWSIEFTPYLWAINMNVKVSGDPIESSVGLDTVELLKNLSGYAMADLNVQYQRAGLMADGMWSRLKTSDSIPNPPTGSYDLDVQLDLAWGTGAAFFEFRPTERLSLSPYVGARWWRMNTQLDVVDTGGPLPPQSGNLITRWADPIFGLAIDYQITDKWMATLAGDVGGGSSKVSWQTMIGGGYQMTDWFALDVVYRVMGVKYEPGSTSFDLKLNGLLFGFKFLY